MTLLLCLLCVSLQAQLLPNNPTVQGNTRFALQLYKQLSKASHQTQDNNVFVSPYSISSALAMTYAGAKGSTAQQMAHTLHFSPKSLDKDYQFLNHHFNHLNSKGLQLSIVNAIWGEKSKKFQPSFLKLNHTYYQAKLGKLDFKNQPKKSRIVINQWVAKKTQDKIKNLIPSGMISGNTRMVLTNAIYFQGKWKLRFDKSNTRKMNFIAHKITYPDIKFMHITNSIKYTENAILQAIELPYAGDKVSTVVLLPKHKNGLYQVEQWLTSKTYQALTTSLFHTKVILHLPKFKMTKNVPLKNALKALGMRIPFTKQADFSKIMQSESLVISEVVHKAFIEVSEKGTEAAAATAVIMSRPRSTSYNPEQPIPPKIFKADHPFMFIIKDNTTGSILFIGRLITPKQAI
ncbi:scca2/scca1 fusion protein isoform 1 [Microscilla marina ATCC 23134]|uniref:Scca2/scca1 fusion protein isoform 1 n=2 Tax=Microscilla marina TaxID=1027 RepID=A1ZEC0_MICM2|nr:scca2/scca1 fusion protein isoform 1 [Microscilla marina ATCC 23134]